MTKCEHPTGTQPAGRTSGRVESTWYIHEVLQVGLQGSEARLDYISIAGVH